MTSLQSLIHRSCPHCGSKVFVKRGYFYRRNSKTYIPRYQCRDCLKSFSTRTGSVTVNQKRIDLNFQIFNYLCSGASMRATAKSLQCSYKTVYLKFLWLSKQAQAFHENQCFQSTQIYFDEMQSIEHTKLKPITIALAVDENYQILGVKVGKIPAQGHLARISNLKYGPRANESSIKIKSLLESLKTSLKLKDQVLFKSDAKPEYKSIMRRVFPKSPYQQYLSRGNKEKRREQKYLKSEKLIKDPLFPLNQRCAKLRDHIKRLTRRSWCTTKNLNHLELALHLYIAKNNAYNLF